jgi:hypothetical protein
MMQTGQALGAKLAPPQHAVKDSTTPRCCGEEMQLLLRRALLHSDGSVDFQAAWGCNKCGRRIL